MSGTQTSIPSAPLNAFSHFQFHPDLERGLKSLGFKTPTAIQESAIPHGMLGRDVLACAMTGSGKTAAFLWPILHQILQKPRTDKSGVTRALIITPTRELAAQIKDHLAELARFTAIRGAAVFGGVGMEPQRQAFMTGVDVLVATPGRLLDHFSYPYAKLSNLEFLVIDEADRMLDMGFLPDIRRVLSHLPRKPRQTMLFSATMPLPIAQLTREILTNPVSLNIDRPSAPAVGIKQMIFPVAEGLKSGLLLKILEKEEIRNAIAFTRTKHRANRLADFLKRHGISCACIHGNRTQSQRTAALEAFRDGKCRILVATDIAARGIDIEGMSHVINFDVPHIPEDYIHRVGRTARANREGDAFTLVSPAEEFDFVGIERHLKKKLPRTMVEGFDYTDRKAESLEIPLAVRIAEIRARKSVERANRARKLAKTPNADSSRTRAPAARSQTPQAQAQNPRSQAPRSQAPRSQAPRAQGSHAPSSRTAASRPAAPRAHSDQKVTPREQAPAKPSQSRAPKTSGFKKYEADKPFDMFGDD